MSDWKEDVIKALGTAVTCYLRDEPGDLRHAANDLHSAMENACKGYFVEQGEEIPRGKGSSTALLSKFFSHVDHDLDASLIVYVHLFGTLRNLATHELAEPPRNLVRDYLDLIPSCLLLATFDIEEIWSVWEPFYAHEEGIRERSEWVKGGKYPPAKPGALVVSRSKRHDVTATRSLAPPKGGYSSNRSCSSRRSSRSCCWTYSRTTRSSCPTVET